MTQTVAYFKSGIGNLLVATPALRALASMDPSGKIDVCMAKGWKDSRLASIVDVIEGLPFVEQIVEFPGPMNGYKTYFMPVQCENSAAGQYVHAHMKVSRDRWPGANWYADKHHEIDVNMRYVRALGYVGEAPPICVPVAEGPALDLPRPIIGLCNGAFPAKMWDKKHWPYFARFADTARRWFGGSVIGVGGPGEMDGVPLDADFCGKLRFTESTKVISQVDLFVSTDTGCMHAADGLGVPLIALFGSTLTSKNRPVGKHSMVIQSKEPCAPCQYTDRFHICGVYRCMETITIGRVMRIARRVL